MLKAISEQEVTLLNMLKKCCHSWRRSPTGHCTRAGFFTFGKPGYSLTSL